MASAFVWGLWTASSPPADAAARLAALEAEGSALNDSADQLETRLLAGQAQVHAWEELGRRHRDVSELACRVTDRHLESMVMVLEQQEEKSHHKAGAALAQAGLALQAD